MPSTTSPNKGYELQATGENQGTWGVLLNANALSLIDLNFGGRQAVTIDASNVTLTAEQQENVFFTLTGTLTGNRDLIFTATAGGFFWIYNNTSGAFTVTAKPSGGTGFVCTQGAVTCVFINPTSASAVGMGTWTAGVLDLAHGGTGAATASAARTALGLGTIATQAASSVTITGGSITGITDLAVADGGTGASDASGARTNLGLGTIATQAASAVSITGGSITGITDLAVADGGTGASTAATAIQTLLSGLGAITTLDALVVGTSGVYYGISGTNAILGLLPLLSQVASGTALGPGAAGGRLVFRTSGGSWGYYLCT